MDQNEIILRVIGILTESRAMFAALNEDDEADYELSSTVGELFNEMLPTVAIPVEATAPEAGQMVAEAAAMASLNMANAFTFLFSELADVHDAGRSDITTDDLLRKLALRFSSPQPEG